MVEFSLTFSQAVDGFLIDKHAQRLSANTIRDYQNGFRKLAEFLDGDPPLASIDAKTIGRFQIELGEVAVSPAGVAERPARPLSKKSILNIHTALSSLWTWAVGEGYADEHVMQSVPRPRPEERTIIPYTEDDVKRLVRLCSYKARHSWRGRSGYTQSRPTATRDLAILLVLLDTGLRASELCNLRVRDVDAKNHRLTVFGKRDKERILSYGQRTGKAVWRYMVTRTDKRPEDPAFVAYGSTNEPMTRKGLLLLVRRLGERAEISPSATVHRFRHTFAINFLRNGGHLYALQEMLGHTSLEMCRHYLKIARADVEEAHRRASPVDNWKL